MSYGFRGPTPKAQARAALLSACKVIADDLRMLRDVHGVPLSSTAERHLWILENALKKARSAKL